MLLWIFSILSSLALASDDSDAAIGDLSWCGRHNSILNPTPSPIVTITPNPALAGKNITVDIAGVLSADILKGTKAFVTVSNQDLVPLLGFRIYLSPIEKDPNGAIQHLYVSSPIPMPHKHVDAAADKILKVQQKLILQIVIFSGNGDVNAIGCLIGEIKVYT